MQGGQEEEGTLAGVERGQGEGMIIKGTQEILCRAERGHGEGDADDRGRRGH